MSKKIQCKVFSVIEAYDSFYIPLAEVKDQLSIEKTISIEIKRSAPNNPYQVDVDL